MLNWFRRSEAQPDAQAPLSAADVALIQQSFAQVAPIAETAAALFYDRLFSIAPEVKPLFKSDLKEQGRKLMAMLATVVDGLSDLGAVVPAAEELARRHVGYGVEPRHYEPVGEALIWTLKEGLGDAFTPDVRAAWLSAYAVLSGVMIKAASAAKAA